ncbi:MAG: hypothetical protein AAFO04_27510 [Cyanobacteria bacterium J06592_8]
MPYSQFTTIRKVKEAFDLNTVEGFHFLSNISPVHPSQMLVSFLEESLPLAACGSDKARSEGIIYPILLEVRRTLKGKVSLFSGEDFTVDESVGLHGVCDFILSRSPELLEIEAPAIIIKEAKKADLRSGFGQCIAGMVAAQRFNQQFNQQKNEPISTLYGAVSSGTQWRFLKLEGQTVTIDLVDYPLPPVEQILGFLVWMIQEG